MNKFFSRKKAAILALAVPVAMGLPVQVLAQDGEIEEVIITGTRVADRSAQKSPPTRQGDLHGHPTVQGGTHPPMSASSARAAAIVT